MKQLVLFLSLCPLFLNAQSGKRSIEFIAGPSFAAGQLARQSPGGGYANRGAHFGFNYIRLKPENKFGWTLNMEFGWLNLNNKAVTNYLEQSGMKAQVSDSSYWTLGTLMGGIVYRQRYDRFFVEGRALAGFFFGDAPYIEVADPAKLTHDQRLFQNKTAECFGGLGMMLKANAGYFICRKLYVVGGASIYASSPTFTHELGPRGGEFPTKGYSDTYTVTHIVPQFNIGLGINW